MRFRSSLAALAVALPLGAASQTRFLQSVDEAKHAAEGVVASVAANNFSGAWKELRPLSVVPASEFDVFEAQFNSQWGNLLQRYGSALGYELVREDPVGSSLVRYTFLVRHEKAPIRWVLVFYRAEKGWVATDFKFDGSVNVLFPGGG